jgi:hypothetical protein
MNVNDNYRRVPTEFEPEARFEVKPNSPVPFRARQEAELERLKARLLAERLKGHRPPQLDSALQRAANEAAAVAWVTRYPLLVFPALFAEQAEAATLCVERQERIRQRSRELLAA